MARDAYAEAGVDIDAADALIDKIKPLAASTHRAGVLGGLGGFGGLFALTGYRDPILVSGTDGVGTKLLVAQQVGNHRTVGVDLVAMCVNDIAVTGAEPLFFLDYFATGKLEPSAAAEVVSGIAEGCRQAGCALLGGETAEMPGMYGPGHYDLAGFAVGAVERAEILDGAGVRATDVLVGIPSTGLHSNGFSLVRRIVEAQGWPLDSDPGGLDRSLADELLTPTRIYVRDLLSVRDRISAASHITGGGLPGNVPRMLPDGLGAKIRRDTWALPSIFSLLQRAAQLSERDLFRTFNCGLGMVLAVPEVHAAAVAEQVGGLLIGEVVPGHGVEFS